MLRPRYLGVVGLILASLAAKLGANENNAEATSAPPAAEEQTECHVVGRVTSVDGTGLANVTVEWGSIRQPFKRRQSATTDAEGKYTLKLKSLDGHSRLVAFLPGHALAYANSNLTFGRHERNFVLRANPKTSVEVSSEQERIEDPAALGRAVNLAPTTGHVAAGLSSTSKVSRLQVFVWRHLRR